MEWVPIFLAIFKGSVLLIGMFYAIKWHHDQDKKIKNEGHGWQSPTEMRLFVTMIIALALSLIGIVYAGCWGNAADGGRGGALGCTLTFLMCIVTKTNAKMALTDRLGQASAAQSGVHAEPDSVTRSEALDRLAILKVQAEQLHAAFLARLESAEREKIYLSVASIVSAISWKFGDTAAAWLNFGR
jgi:hypothetical protein